MPIYEYSCEACGKRSSALLARYDSEDPACPFCGAHQLHRLVSTFATVGSDEGGTDFGDDGAEDEGFGGGHGHDEFGGDDLGDDDW